MANVGDKFIIEIGEKYAALGYSADGQATTPEELYRISGFDSLVFDAKGLYKLKKYKESPFSQEDCDRARSEGYQQALTDFRKALKELYNKMPTEVIKNRKYFDVIDIDRTDEEIRDNVLLDYMPTTILKQIKAY